MTSDDHQHERLAESADPAAGLREPQEAAAPGPGHLDVPDAGDVPDTGADESDLGEDIAVDTRSELVSDLTRARQDAAGLTADLQRLQAEYVNYKRRVDRDRELVKQNATFQVLTGLLPVLDDIDRAREHGEVEGGFKAVADSLERIVSGLGLVRYGEPGDEFDPNLHEALMHAHSAEVTTTTCQDIIHSGYRIGDRVVRPARVTVVDPEPAAEPGPAEAGAVEAGPADGSGPSGEQGPSDD